MLSILHAGGCILPLSEDEDEIIKRFQKYRNDHIEWNALDFMDTRVRPCCLALKSILTKRWYFFANDTGSEMDRSARCILNNLLALPDSRGK